MAKHLVLGFNNQVQLREFHGHNVKTKSLSWKYNGSNIMSSSEDGVILMWDIKEGLKLSAQGKSTTPRLFYPFSSGMKETIWTTL